MIAGIHLLREVTYSTTCLPKEEMGVFSPTERFIEAIYPVLSRLYTGSAMRIKSRDKLRVFIIYKLDIELNSRLNVFILCIPLCDLTACT